MSKKKVRDDEFETMKRVHSNANKYVSRDFHFYLSYGARVALIFVGVLVIGILAYYCFKQSFSKVSKEVLNYDEKTTLDFSADLFDNPLGVTNDEGVDSYLSELVDNINNSIHYEYHTDHEVNVKYKYRVDVTMELENADTKKNFHKNTYSLIDEVSDTVKNTKIVQIDQGVKLDYDFFNEKAKDLEQLADGVVSGNLILKMYITLETNYEKFAKPVTKEEVIEIKTPLLSSQVSSVLVSKEKNADKYMEEAKPELVNESMLYSGVALLIVDTMFLLTGVSFIFRSTPKKSKYCKLRDGLLDEYGSIIVNVRKMPSIKGKNVMDCYSFGELMDAQRILNKPIVFYELVKDQKCTFFIVGDNDIYEYTLKEADIEF